MNIFGEGVLGGLSGGQLALLVVVQLWDLIWKGFALWRAARKRDIFWFVLLILVNSAGLLPAFYLFYISEAPKKRVVKVGGQNKPGAGDKKVDQESKTKKK